MPRIRLKRGTTDRWELVNPILKSGEAGFETNDEKTIHNLKIGDGVKTWDELPYINNTGFDTVFNNLSNTDVLTYNSSTNTWVNKPIESFSGETTTARIVYYVDETTGTDIATGGTISTPWQSLEYAIQHIPINLTFPLKIVLGIGDYHLTSNTLNRISDFMLLEQLVISGTMELVRDDFTAKIADPNLNVFKRLVSGATWDTENQYTGYCARHDNWAATTGYVYAPIGPHETNNISSTMISEGYWVGAIYSYSTNIFFDDGRSPRSLLGSAKILFRNAKITLPSTTDTQFFNTGSPKFMFLNCNINLFGDHTLKIEGNVKFNHVTIITDSDTSPAIDINQSNRTLFESLFICYLGITSSSESAIVIDNSSCNFKKLYIYGYAYGIEGQGNVELYSSYGHYPNMMDHVGCAFRLTNSGFKWDYGEWYGIHRFFIFSVNYMYSMNGATDDIKLYFPPERLHGDSAPLEEWFVPASGGLWGGISNKLKALRDKPVSYIDLTKGVTMYYPSLYPEISASETITILNSTSGETIIGDINQNKFIYVDYTISRSGMTEGGTILMTNKDDTTLVDNDEFDDTGVIFTKLVSNNLIYLKWTSTDIGADSILTFNVRRILS